VSKDVALTIAISDYDHVRDLRDGRVETPGLDLRFFDMPVPQLFGRFTTYREWDVSEFGMGKYVALKSQGDNSITAIPVFPSRTYRHTAFYVHVDSPLEHLEELAGKRVGVPEWAQTATVYARGMLAQTIGVDLASIVWFQAGVNEPGRKEKVSLRLPDGVHVTPMPEASLNEMLLDGRLDAIISAQAPTAFLADGGAIRRLLADPYAGEVEYYRQTGVFPIMHTVAIKQEIVDEHRWLPGNLVAAFEQAKKRSLARARDEMISRYPIPSVSTLAGNAAATYGDDFWPYGLEANRQTLEAFLLFAYEQGVASRLLEPEELFAPTTHVSFPA
jgi:4,5-dihydroxyphthalate decarboxylase